MRRTLELGATAVVAAIGVAALLALTGVFDEDDGSGPPSGAVAGGGKGTAAVVDRVRAGVVSVTARARSGTASGPGFLIDRDGSIVTSRHVVAGAREVSVLAEGSDGAIPAERLGGDPATDIALLKISRADARDIEPLRLGDDAGTAVGEPVLAVGPPFGLEGNVTYGVVSALDRAARIPGGQIADGLIETDAAVDRQNAGGPLVDGSGRVVGVNVLGTRPGGFGHAVPVGTLTAVAQAIREQGDLRAPYLGIETIPVTPGLAELLGLSVEHGLLVRSVERGSPAAAAGLRPATAARRAGDVITMRGGAELRRPRDLELALQTVRPGRAVTLTVVRGEKTRQVRLRPARAR